MKIAIPSTSEGYVDGHFGHCESYRVYSLSETNEIAGIKTIKSSDACGCKSNIASVLAAEGVKIMLAGGIGGGAINVLKSNGIEVIRGCSGKADEVVGLYIEGKITDSGSSCHVHEAHGKDQHFCHHN